MSNVQPFIDRLDVVEEGEPLRASWHRYLDFLAKVGPLLAELPEPVWPTQLERRALAAAGLAYRHEQYDLDLPEWLDSPYLISPAPISATPQFAELQKPLTPAIVAKYNVVCDEASFHSV